jgi:putative oxidoreductase
MAVITQAFGGLCFLLGLFFRWACFALALTMAVAILYHWKKGDSLIMEGGQAVLFFSVFIAFMFIGAGKISICKDSCCGSRCDCAHKESDKCNNNDDHTGCCC